MQKSLSVALLMALLLAFAGGTAAQSTGFSDVAGTRYADAFAYLGGRGLVQGYRDGTGRPDAMITRVEVLKVLVEMEPKLRERAQWYSAHLPPIALFPDVDQDAWYAPYLEAAFEAGIVTGYPDRSFHPSSPIAAEEGIVLLMRAAGEDAPQQNMGKPWYGNAAAKAFARNLISPHERLRLGNLLTRGQFFDMAYRFAVVRRDSLVAFAEPAWTPPLRPVVAAQPVAPFTARPAGATPQGSPAVVALSGKPFAVTIPSLGISDLAVTHPADSTTQKGLLSVLAGGVGHLFSYPGGAGKIMIYGHSSGYSWDVSKYTRIFRKINELNPGDRVYVTYKGKLHAYEVTSKQAVPANDLRYFSGGGEELILYTCWPPDSIKERFLVHAVPVSSVASR